MLLFVLFVLLVLVDPFVLVVHFDQFFLLVQFDLVVLVVLVLRFHQLSKILQVQ